MVVIGRLSCNQHYCYSCQPAFQTYPPISAWSFRFQSQMIVSVNLPSWAIWTRLLCWMDNAGVFHCLSVLSTKGTITIVLETMPVQPLHCPASTNKTVEAKKQKLHLAGTLVLQIKSTDEGPMVGTMLRHKQQTQHCIWTDARWLHPDDKDGNKQDQWNSWVHNAY
jgi:hypothetical protein